MANSQNQGEAHGMSNEEMMRHLGGSLDRMPNEVRVILFAGRDDDDNVFSQVARQSLELFSKMSKKVRVEEYPLDHELARKYGIETAPTLLFNPETYNIRWLGAPAGEEGRTFMEILFLIGFGQSSLSEQSIRMMNDLDGLRSVKVFVSPSCPYCPQQAVNAARAMVQRPDLVSLELIDIQANPDIADDYGAHSVPQTFAEDLLIGLGAQAEEVFIQSLQKLEEQRIFIPESTAELVETDLLIVGGGPAGLTAGIYAKRSGLKTALVEKGVLGGQVATTPVVENYPGFTSVGGKTLVDIMVQHALEYIDIFQGEEVLAIEPGQPIAVQTSRRRFNTQTLLIATGATHKHLGIPGEDRLSGRGVSYCSTCDGPLFKGKKVIMVGGGNSAVTEALYLYHMGVDVTLVHRRDNLRAQEYLIKSLKDNGIPVLWNTEIKEILGEERVKAVALIDSKTKEESNLPIDGVFVAIGYSPSVQLAEKIGVALTPEGYIKRDERHRTNIPGIYSAGDVEGGYKQIVTAAGQGAEAAISIFEDLINPYWKQGKK